MENSANTRTDKEQASYLTEIVLALQPTTNTKPMYYSSLVAGFGILLWMGDTKGKTLFNGLVDWGLCSFVALIGSALLTAIVGVVVSSVIKKGLRLPEHEVTRSLALEKVEKLTQAVVFIAVPVTLAALSLLLGLSGHVPS